MLPHPVDRLLASNASCPICRPVQVYAAILDEFGSTLDNPKEMSCMKSIETYANGLAPTSLKTHAPLTSWFFW